MCPAVAYEMVVSHSPPVFSHSPPAGFLSEYNTPVFLDSRIFRPPTCSSPHKDYTRMPASPKRPCLVIRPDETSTSADDDPVSPTRLKKKVVFADDKGMSLTHVRVMSEPSNVPPSWSNRFLAEVTQGLSAEPEVLSVPWEITFPQPASDYVEFRKTLDANKVSLENVIVKESEEVVAGTVKVSNISFKKEVLVRASFDDWKTFEDVLCVFVPNCSSSVVTAAYVLYDTFSFKISLPSRANKIEFCVCFRCEGNEYWDNNNEKNYTIIQKTKTPVQKSPAEKNNHQTKNGKAVSSVLPPKCADVVQAKLDSWSEFASWTHLDNSGPYW